MRAGSQGMSRASSSLYPIRMAKRPSITLEVLPASFGDCLLLTFSRSRSDWLTLVDTGPDETYPALRARLMLLPKNSEGRRHIDLFVVTHIDHDHIGAARLLLDDEELALSFGDIWFNAPKPVATRGVAEGQHLAQFLERQRRRCPGTSRSAESSRAHLP